MEFKRSRASEIAIELFGLKKGAQMQTADIYQALARGVVKMEAEEFPLITQRTPDEEAAYIYGIGYDAQLEDAVAPAGHRYKNLNELSDDYKLGIVKRLLREDSVDPGLQSS